jgi:hypothetical protein
MIPFADGFVPALIGLTFTLMGSVKLGWATWPGLCGFCGQYEQVHFTSNTPFNARFPSASVPDASALLYRAG